MPARRPVSAAADAVIWPMMVPGAEAVGNFSGRQREGLEHVFCPLVAADVEGAERVGAGPACGELSRQAADDPGVRVVDMGDAGEQVRLGTRQPREAVDGGRPVQRLAGQSVQVLDADFGGEGRDLGLAAFVQPQDRGAQRGVAGICDRYGFALVDDGDGGDAVGGDLGQDAGQRGLDGVPPCIRVLLVSVRLRPLQGERCSAFGNTRGPERSRRWPWRWWC